MLFAITQLSITIAISIFLFILIYRSYRQRKLLSNIKYSDSSIPILKYNNRFLFSIITSLFVFIIINIQLYLFQYPEKINNENNQLFFLLDISNSMNALDADNYNISRLEAAKKVILQITNNNENYDFGLIIFAGNAELLIPACKDTIYLKQIITNIETNYFTTSTTNLENALILASKSFNNANNKILMILTDGENQYGNINNGLKKIYNLNINVICIGFGSDTGSKIKLNNNYLQDINGNEVITKLNTYELNQIDQSYLLYPQNINKLTNQILDATNKKEKTPFMQNFIVLCCFMLIIIKITIE